MIHQRKIRNLLIDRKFQIKSALFISGAAVCSLAALFAVFMQRLHQLSMNILEVTASEAVVSTLISKALRDLSVMTLWTIVIAAVILFLLSIVFTHRVAGAARGIQNYINDLRNGDYETNRQLRKHDYLQNIMMDLRRFARELKKGHR